VNSQINGRRNWACATGSDDRLPPSAWERQEGIATF